MAAKKDDGRKVVAENRKARFEYFITDTWEAGLMLTGTEVKSLRKGHSNIAESYASVEPEGLMLLNHGAKAIFFIPTKLAYDQNSPTPDIPAGSDLVFYVEVQ